MDQPTLSAMSLEEGEDGWHLIVEEAPSRLGIRLGMDGWAVSERPVTGAPDLLPVATCAGWSDARTLHVEVLFLETPHRLLVDLTLSSRTFEARWHTMPLSGGLLSDLRSPW